MKQNKFAKVISKSLNVILTLALIFMIFVVIASKASGGEPNFLGYQLKTVLSGSMEPTFMTGSIIAIDPSIEADALQVGDIITFKTDETTLVTHRIIEVVTADSRVMYRMQGDNNDGPDGQLVIPQNVVGVYTGFTVPYIGYFMDFADSQSGILLLLILPGVLLLIYAIYQIWQALKMLDSKIGKDSNELV